MVKTQATQKIFYRRRSCWLLSALLLCVCSSWCVVAIVAAPSIEELNATKTVESAELVAQNITPQATPSSPTRIPTNTPRPVIAISSAVSATAGVYRLDIHRVWEVTEADGQKPERVSFLILETSLHNDSSEEVCFYRNDFKADARGRDIEPSSMDHIRDEFYEGVDYPGPTFGQCVQANDSERSLLVYDIPENLTSITIEFTPKDDKAKFKLWLTRQENGEYLFGLDSFSDGAAIQATFTIIPTATSNTAIASNTPLPTLTKTSSVTPLESAINNHPAVTNAELVSVLPNGDGWLVHLELEVQSGKNNQQTADELRQLAYSSLGSAFVEFSVILKDGSSATDWVWDNEDDNWRETPLTQISATNIQSASGTRYINTQSLNVRACPSTDCQRLGSLNFGTAVTLTGQLDGWYRIQFNGSEGWIASQYTSANQPTSNQNSGNSTTIPNNQNNQPVPTAVPVQPIPSGGGCNGASSCGQMTSCEQAYACLNAGNGDLDRDKDGVPCESICPGG